MIFDSSVSGLQVGGNVLFNGIRVGEVTNLRLDPDKPSQVVAMLAVNKSTPIRSDTRVGLEFAGSHRCRRGLAQGRFGERRL